MILPVLPHAAIGKTAIQKVEIAAPTPLVIVMAGQSNMAGTVASGDFGFAAPSNVREWNGTNWVDAKWDTNTGPEARFAHYVAPYVSDLRIVKHAVGSTGLATDWDPATGPEYATLLSDIDDALATLESPQIVAFCWMQGERDSTSATWSAAYATNLANFISSVRSDIEPGMLFIMGRIHDDLPSGTYPYASTVRAAQDGAASSDVLVIDTDSFRVQGDNIHFTEHGTNRLGATFGYLFLSEILDAPAYAFGSEGDASYRWGNQESSGDIIELIAGGGTYDLEPNGGSSSVVYGTTISGTRSVLDGRKYIKTPSSGTVIGDRFAAASNPLDARNGSIAMQCGFLMPSAPAADFDLGGHFDTGSARGWRAFMTTTGVIRVNVNDGTGANIAELNGNYADNVWHFFEVIVDWTAGQLRIRTDLQSASISLAGVTQANCGSDSADFCWFGDDARECGNDFGTLDLYGFTGATAEALDSTPFEDYWPL